MTSQRRVLVSGIGNEMRHDDGAGPVAARLAMEALEAASVTASDEGVTTSWSQLEEPLDLLADWDGVDLAVVVDAVRSGAPAGTVRVVWFSGEEHDAKATPERTRETSSHGLGVTGVYRLARALGRAPERLALIGIEGQDFSQGDGLSDPVEAAVEVAAGTLVEIISARSSGRLGQNLQLRKPQ